jgi:hypothetical protein
MPSFCDVWRVVAFQRDTMASATTNTTMSNSQAADLDSTRLRADMSDHTLIGLLQASIDRHRTTADDLKTSSELQSRDEKRTLIMLKLAQEQVERSKEANDKLIRETDATRQRNAVLEEEVAQLRTTVDDLEAKQRVVHSTHDRSLRDVATELKAERGEHATTQNGPAEAPRGAQRGQGRGGDRREQPRGEVPRAVPGARHAQGTLRHPKGGSRLLGGSAVQKRCARLRSASMT